MTLVYDQHYVDDLAKFEIIMSYIILYFLCLKLLIKILKCELSIHSSSVDKAQDW